MGTTSPASGCTSPLFVCVLLTVRRCRAPVQARHSFRPQRWAGLSLAHPRAAGTVMAPVLRDPARCGACLRPALLSAGTQSCGPAWGTTRHLSPCACSHMPWYRGQSGGQFSPEGGCEVREWGPARRARVRWPWESGSPLVSRCAWRHSRLLTPCHTSAPGLVPVPRSCPPGAPQSLFASGRPLLPTAWTPLGGSLQPPSAGGNRASPNLKRTVELQSGRVSAGRSGPQSASSTGLWMAPREGVHPPWVGPM